MTEEDLRKYIKELLDQDKCMIMIDEHIKKHIKELLDQRDVVLNKEEDSGISEDIEEVIRKEIKDNSDRYEVDFIIETLARLGDAPNLMYDDNGLFQISSIGLQQVVFDDGRISQPMVVYVEKEDWFPTIREALKHYLSKA